MWALSTINAPHLPVPFLANRPHSHLEVMGRAGRGVEADAPEALSVSCPHMGLSVPSLKDLMLQSSFSSVPELY